MPLLKSTLLWIFILSAIYIGGQWTQSASSAAQGFGFVTIVISAVCLYIIFKLMSGSIGGFFKFVLFCIICVYSAYSLGLFDEEVRNSFLNGKSNVTEQNTKSDDKNSKQSDILADQMFGNNDNNDTQNIIPKKQKKQSEPK